MMLVWRERRKSLICIINAKFCSLISLLFIESGPSTMTRALHAVPTSGFESDGLWLGEKKDRENGGSRHLPTLAWIR